MAYQLNDFKCSNGHTFERLTKIDERDEPQACPDCQTLGNRIITPIKFSLDPSKGFPGAENKFVKSETKANIAANKYYAEHHDDPPPTHF